MRSSFVSSLCLLFPLLHFISSQLDISWSSCPVFSYSTSLCQFVEPNLQLTNLTQCGVTSVNYFNDDPKSISITYAMKRYLSSANRMGTVIILGDIIAGNGGPALETIAVTLYNTMNGTFDVVIPDMRGTFGSTPLKCPGDISLDFISINPDCQMPYASTYGVNMQGFSVDEIAKDTLKLVQTLKQETNKPMYLFGRSIGSYIVHRMLQINASMIDAVIMDGVCAGKYCNASDWDVQRDLMGRKLLSLLSNFNQSTTYKQYEAMSYDVKSTYESLLYTFLLGLPLCGWEINPQSTILKETSTMSMFDQSVRPYFFSSVLQLTRCSIFDYGKNRYWLFVTKTQTSDSFMFLKCRSPLSAVFMSTHITFSELIDPNVKIESDSLIFSQLVGLYANRLLIGGWKPYNVSSYRDTIASYNKPMLMLNGDFDPQAPLSQATQFADNFQSQHQHFIIMPGMSSSSFLRSNLRNGTTTCGKILITQFLSCPNCTLDTSCVQNMVGLTFDGDDLTTQLFGNVWDTSFIPPSPISAGIAILYGVITPLPLIVLIMLIIFRNYKRVRSRVLAPHIGLLYIIAHQVLNIIITSAENDSLPYQVIAVVVTNVLLVSAVTVFLIQIIRFFILNFLYTSMSRSIFQNIKVLRLLTSRFIFSSTVIIMTSIWTIFGTIVAVLSYYYGYDILISPFIYATILYVVIVVIIVIVLNCYDFISQVIITRCDLFSYFFVNDPLMFRLDTLLVFPILIFAIIGNILNIITYSFIIRIISAVFDQLSILLMISYFGGNVCFMCIIDIIRGNNYNIMKENGSDSAMEETEKNDQQIVLEILSDEVGGNYLSQYCTKEFSLENIIAYREVSSVIDHFPEMSPKERLKTLNSIRDRFLQRNSEMELNLKAEVLRNYNAMMQVDINSEYDRVQVLQRLRESVMNNIIDTFSRFKLTQEYVECLSSMKVRQKMSTHYLRQ